MEYTVEPDLIAMEMLAFLSNSKNDTNLPVGISQTGGQLPYTVHRNFSHLTIIAMIASRKKPLLKL